MTNWNEADHPRDEDGKFTYKNGGGPMLYGGIEYNDKKESRENVLYKDSSLKSNLSNYRNKLVNFLGNSLDRAELLFSNVKELEDKILDNTISTIKISREKLYKSVNNLSKNDFKSNIEFQNLAKKLKNTHKALNRFEEETNNVFKINTKKEGSLLGEKNLTNILSYKNEIEKDCNEIIMVAERITNQKSRTGNTLTDLKSVNKEESRRESSQIKTENGKDEEISSAEITTNWIMPVNGRISSPYGWRIDPITKKQTFHSGIDISIPVGTDVKSIADGKVYFSGKGDPHGYAHFIIIDHGKINGVNITSEYGHISQHLVSNGQKVKKGQVIAKSGNEGKSSGPHLHLTIREGVYKGKHVSPSKYIEY